MFELHKNKATILLLQWGENKLRITKGFMCQVVNMFIYDLISCL